MALAPYTTPQLVRAALGVEALEISDTTLNLPLYSTALTEGLYAISDTLPADFAAAVADLSAPGATRLRDLTEAYSTYFVALQCMPAIPLFAPREIRDDRTTMVRVDDPFKKLREQLAEAMAFILNILKTAYLVFNPDAEIKTYTPVLPTVAVASTINDPVVQ